MRINFSILSETAVQDPSGKMIIGQPISFITLPAFPSAFTVAWSFGVLGVEMNLHPHNVKFSAFDPDGGVVFQEEAVLNAAPEVASANEQNLSSFVGTIDLRNVLFTKPGTYRFNLKVDDSEHETLLDVVKDRSAQ